LIGIDEALLRVEPDQVVQLLLPRFDEKAKQGRDERRPPAREGPECFALEGRPARPGSMQIAPRSARSLEPSVILVRPETNPDDVHGCWCREGF
jgi:pyruvate,orthophosphate dikinase